MGSQTLLNQQPVVTAALQTGTDLRITFDIDLSHPKDVDLDRFNFVDFPMINPPVSGAIAFGRLQFTMTNANPISRVDYLGGPPPIKAVNRAVLEPFTTPVPFP